MAKKENPHNSDEGMAAGAKEMQEDKGKKGPGRPKKPLNATGEAVEEPLPSEEILRQLTEYYEKVEKRIKGLKEQTAALEMVAQGCADTIEGLVAVTGMGKEM